MISEFKLYAYCLMGNHLHLIIRVEKEPLEQIFKRICGRYVYWYNAKYHRVEHLFQDRFKSEPIEDERYFLGAIRYIHQNPVKAGLVKKVGEYPYRSYSCYMDRDNIPEYEKEIERVKKQLKTSKTLRRSEWEEKNQNYLEVLEKMLARIYKEGLIHKNGSFREECDG